MKRTFDNATANSASTSTDSIGTSTTRAEVRAGTRTGTTRSGVDNRVNQLLKMVSQHRNHEWLVDWYNYTLALWRRVDVYCTRDGNNKYTPRVAFALAQSHYGHVYPISQLNAGKVHPSPGAPLLPQFDGVLMMTSLVRTNTGALVDPCDGNVCVYPNARPYFRIITSISAIVCDARRVNWINAHVNEIHCGVNSAMSSGMSRATQAMKWAIARPQTGHQSRSHKDDPLDTSHSAVAAASDVHATTGETGKRRMSVTYIAVGQCPTECEFADAASVLANIWTE